MVLYTNCGTGLASSAVADCIPTAEKTIATIAICSADSLEFACIMKDSFGRKTVIYRRLWLGNVFSGLLRTPDASFVTRERILSMIN